MIQIVSESIKADSVRFYYEDDSCLPLQQLFQGKFLQTAWMQQETKGVTLCVGMGRKGKDKIAIKEMCAKAVKEMKSNEIRTFSMDIGPIVEGYGIESIRDITEGAILGTYEPLKFPLNHVEEMQIELYHLKKEEQE
ncbi:MAG: M17 family peptidase N-terminal domain-containing protein, partial [Lachnospiraceae bacterium]